MQSLSRRLPLAVGRHGGNQWPQDDPGDRIRALLTQNAERPFRGDPIQVSQWKRQLLENASELFGRGKKTKDKEAGEAKEAELFQQYCFAEA